MTKWLLGSLLSMVLSIFYLLLSNASLRRENTRLEGNQAVLFDTISYLRLENGKNIASVAELTLAYDEISNHCDNLINVVEDLQLRLSRVNNASVSTTHTEVQLKTVIRDSIVYHYRADSCRYFFWCDPWIRLHGNIKKDSISVDVSSIDTITTILYRVPKKFWFIRYGTKEIRQVVTSSNPHSKITYTECIKVRK